MMENSCCNCAFIEIVLEKSLNDVFGSIQSPALCVVRLKPGGNDGDISVSPSEGKIGTDLQ